MRYCFSLKLYFVHFYPPAGNAVLFVGMVSPTGVPVAELTIKKANPTTYNVTYKVQEAGEHALYVRWGDDEVPGSPFIVST